MYCKRLLEHNSQPFIQTISVEGNTGIGMTDYSIVGDDIISSESVELIVELKNYSDSDETDVTAIVYLNP